MGGKHISVCKETFIQTLNDVENTNTFPNWKTMQEGVANSVYGRSIGISAANVYQYILKWGITPKTPRGKRGAGLKRLHDPNNTVRMCRSDKWKNSPVAMDSLKEVRKDVEHLTGKARFASLLEKFEAGSMKSSIALHCITCAGGSTAEVRNCEIRSCPLFNFRPYKAENNDDELADILIDDVPMEEVK